MIENGTRFGALVVIRKATKEERINNKFKRVCYVCQCDCGKIVVKQDRSLSRCGGTDYSKAKLKDKRTMHRLSCDDCRKSYDNIGINEVLYGGVKKWI